MANLRWTFPLGLLLALSVRAQEDLDRVWEARTTPDGRERALRALEAASRDDGATPVVFERLLRLRFWLGSEVLPEGSPARMAT